MFSAIVQLAILNFSIANSIRGRELMMTKNIECESNINNSCVCPYNCLSYDNSTGYCQPKDCWKWDEMKSECVEDGKSFLPAIILQAIPFTGMFGSKWKYGSMGYFWSLYGSIFWRMFTNVLYSNLLFSKSKG